MATTNAITTAGVLVFWRGAAAIGAAALRAAVHAEFGEAGAGCVPRRDAKKPATALARAMPRRSSRVGAFWRLLDDDPNEVVAVYAEESADAAAGAYDAHGATVVRVDRTTGDLVASGPHVAEAEELRARYDVERGALTTTDVGRVIVALLSAAGAVAVSPGIYVVGTAATVEAIDRALDVATVTDGMRPALRWAVLSGAEAERFAPDVDTALGDDLAALVGEAEALAAEIAADAAAVDGAPTEAAKRARRQAMVASKRLERLDRVREAIRGLSGVLGARQQRLEQRAAACETVLLDAARACLSRS